MRERQLVPSSSTEDHRSEKTLDRDYSWRLLLKSTLVLADYDGSTQSTKNNELLLEYRHLIEMASRALPDWFENYYGRSPKVFDSF